MATFGVPCMGIRPCVGEGTSSKVYMINAKVCVKVISNNSDMESMRDSELEYWKRSDKMRHDSLIRPYHLFQNEHGEIELTMPLYHASLHDVISRRRDIDPKYLNHMHSKMLELLDGIRVLHASDFIHFDIKPENILVTDEHVSRLVLTDFGLSRAVTRDGRDTIDDVATLWYRAPEILHLQLTTDDDDDDEDPRMGAFDARAVDVWACGAVYAEWVRGEAVFRRAAICCGKDVDDTSRDDETGWRTFKSSIEQYGIHGNPSVPTRHTNVSKMRELLRFTSNDNPIVNNVVTLICRMLHVDPKMRITAASAVENE